MKKIIIKVEGMHCEKCKERLQNYLTKQEQIEEVNINLETKTVEIIGKEFLEKEMLKELIEEIGFTCVEEK